MNHNHNSQEEAEVCAQEFLDQLKRFPLQISRIDSPEERLFMLAHHFYDFGLVYAKLHGITPTDIARVLSRLTGYFKVADVPMDQIDPEA